MTKIATIAIIGAGNMGSSLLGGLIANHYPPNLLRVADPSKETAAKLKNLPPVYITTHNHEAIKDADIIILCVKPTQLAAVTREIKDFAEQHKPLLISVAAGVRVDSLQTWLNADIPIVRAMPNTPALISCGATALYANAVTSSEQRLLTESIFNTIGTTTWVSDEKLMDIITPLSGSGPAYFFLIIEALQNAAIELGLPPETARQLTLQTAYGATRMALQNPSDIVELRQRVTSKGGTTEQAVRILEEHHIRDIFKEALDTAKRHSEMMAEKIR